MRFADSAATRRARRHDGAGRFHGTVWGPELADEVPKRFLGIYRWVFPAKYLFFFLFGVAGIIARVPSIAKFVSVGYADIWTVAIGLAGLAALIGLVFRRWWPELVGTIGIDVLFLSYVISMAVLGFGGDLNRLALAVGLPVFMVMPAWRVIDIVSVERRRNA